MPLGITEHNGVLWVSGANEMLARSEDQGRTWKMVHFKKSGQLLFAIAFAGSDGWAMGSQGVELHSDDDGAHWKPMHRAPVNVMRLVAADAQHLMASSPQGFLMSLDGGKTWVAKGMPIPKQFPPQMYPVTGVAILDAEHAGALLEMRPSRKSSLLLDIPQQFASTSDGGKTWQIIKFPAGVRIFSLSRDAYGYMAPGLRRSGKSTQPVVFHSADGTHWSRSPNKPAVNWCHRSACLLSSISGWVNWEHGTATHWKTASMPDIVNHWAAVPGVLCVVGDGVQCALAQRLAAAPPDSAEGPVDSIDPFHGTVPEHITSPKCRHCGSPLYPEPDRKNRISGEVLLHILIDRNGRMQDITLLSAPSWSLAQAAMKVVRGWVVQPTRLNGRPVKVGAEVEMHFRLIE